MIGALVRLWRPPTPEELARQQLADARLRLLEAQDAVEFAQSIADYHRTRIARLESLVPSETPANLALET